MHGPINFMDKSISMPVVRETRFRTPGGFERECGLWVDRIGCAGEGQRMPRQLRILGQYAAIEIENGAGRLLTGTLGEWDVRPGDAILLTPREPAAYGPISEWYTRWIVWNGPEAIRLAARLDSSLKPVLRGGAEPVRRAFFALVPRMDGENLASALERKATLLAMHAGLLRCRSDRRSDASRTAGLERVLAHIQENLGSPLPLSELARICGLSVPHFRRVFRRHTGRCPVEFVTAQRVARAKELLLHGLPIKSVAREVGIPDPLYFMRVFKKATGQTAGRFAALHRTSV